ncbi:MAG: hypothetical protein GC164_04805 [Phycisphaera sp.]|nr:hypothetical protein [Phycisphaera sp.]
MNNQWFFRASNALVVFLAFVAPAKALPHAQTGDLYLLEYGRGAIVRIDGSGTPTIGVARSTIAAATGGAGVDFENRGIVFDAAGNMYFTEGVSRSILKRATDGTVSVLSSQSNIAGVTGHASANPRGVDIAADGNLYVTDSVSNSVLKVNPTTGATSVFANEASLLAAAVAANTTPADGTRVVSIKTGIAATPNGKLYVVSDGDPDTVFELDTLAAAAPKVVAAGLPLFDLDLFASTNPLNNQVVIGNDGSGGGGDAGHASNPPKQPDQYFTLDPTGPSLNVFINEAALDALASLAAGVPVNVDLEGGTAFDRFGNFYFGDLTTNSIYKVDPSLNGSLFVSATSLQNLTGVAPDFEGGMAFAPLLRDRAIPEPVTATLGLMGLMSLTLRARRRR